MDPTTGVLALAGLSLAGLLGMKYKKNEEGFTVLNGPGTGGYDTSVAESQTRYNKFSGMINPLVNAVIPLGSDHATAETQRQKVNQALGNLEAVFSKDKNQTLALKEVVNKNIPRAEGKRSLFGAMQFCREAAAKTDKPFSIRDPETNAITKPSEKSAEKNTDGTPIWDFDEVCGICLSKGIDEEGKIFTEPRGLLLDPTAKLTANEERARKGLAFPRTKPALATCEGAPTAPVFATNNDDLTRFQRRLKCQHSTTVGAPDNCAICFEHDTRSYVPLKDDLKNGVLAAAKQVINLNLQGAGKATVSLTGKTIANITLNKNTVQSIPLTDAIEGQEFGVAVERPDKNSLPQLYGYIESSTPGGGKFRMPLNLILIKDKMAGGIAPNRSYGFFKYTDFNLISAIMGPASGKTSMSLTGLVPFTFVQPDDFAALDCPAAPFQASADTIRDYAKDQPCFTKDAKPGEYSTACLQELILGAGCTSQGTLYNNPQELNGTKLVKNDLARIFSILEDIKDNDMVDGQKTMKCSGRRLARPCDPFIARTDLKFLPILMDNRNSEMKDNAAQCLALIYGNAGATEKDSNLGATYSGLVTYKNDQRERKNIYCLPEGKLNPEKSIEALMALARIADQGYDNVYSVQAVKKYLNEQLELAADWRYNANKDSGRKTAIANCFGKELSEIPQLKAQDPTILEDVCGILAKYIRIRPKSGTGSVGVSQIVAVDSKGNNVAVNQDTSLSSVPKDLASAATAAVDGILAVRSGTLPQYLSKQNTANVQFVVDLGTPKDITKVIFYGANTSPYNTAKAGLVIELLDENKTVLATRDSTASMIDKFDFLLPEADPTTCKTELIVQPVSAPTPIGYVDGLFGRFYQITNDNPGTALGSSGWGDKIGDSGIYTDISVDTTRINGAYAFFIKGYYIVNEPHILYLQGESSNGFVITLNNVQVINTWNNAVSSTFTTSPLYLQYKGLYPFQVSFLRKANGSLGNFFKLAYKINDETEWKIGLKGIFAYNTNEEQLLDEQWQQELRRREEAARAAAAAAALATRNAKIAEFQSQLAIIKNTMMTYHKEGSELYTQAEQFSQDLNITSIRTNLVKLREIYGNAWTLVEQMNGIYTSVITYDRSLNTTFDPIVADIKAYYEGSQGLAAILGRMNTLIGNTQKLIDSVPSGYQNGLYVRTFATKDGADLPINISEDIVRGKKSAGGWSVQLTRASTPKTVFGIGYKPNTYISQAPDNFFGNIARGYYFSKNVDHTLQFYVITHGAFYIKFDGKVIQSQAKWGGFGRGYWNFTVQVSGAKRLYPIEIVWESDWVKMGWWRSDSDKPSWEYNDNFTDFFVYNVEEEKAIDEEYKRNIQAINTKVQSLINSGQFYAGSINGTTRYFRVYKNQNLDRACLGYKTVTEQISKEAAVDIAMKEKYNVWGGYEGFNFSVEKRTAELGGSIFISICRFDPGRDYGFRPDINEYQDTYIEVPFDDLMTFS